VDKSVGRVLDALRETGKDKNTIVIFASDQGSLYPNTPLRGGKKKGTALYEGGVKIPFIIKWPGVTKPGSEDETHIQTTDVFPTFIQIAGGNINDYKGLEGLSLVELLRNNTPLDRNELYAFRTYDAQYASVLTSGNWKLIAYLNGKHELYNLNEDISEEHNLASQYPEKVQELLKKLEKWKKKVGVDI
jgi:arylsulfatase A-like enzyme